ncbi:carbohydrate ABC transporter permease [Embleya scabrispora]|uniref:carbohydrate ABC transporter permease n=1 Tax=Embleya scabrispora TaxID=159449 RepID=UPI000477EF60|nr:carbohydrate ABC transporter permease [Embleya scabrispora]MYS79618.1 ABC transporter permease subunit [Streptomyces sp. SID5474]
MSTGTRGVMSEAERRRPLTRIGLGTTQLLLIAALVIEGAGPIYWVFKGSISSTQESLRHPLALWPEEAHWSNISTAWTSLDLGRYLMNTVVLVGGSWFVQLFVAVTGAYALSVLRPFYGKYVYAAVLATLFLPGTVSMVSLYLTIQDLPLTGGSIANTPMAVWLPAGAHAFNVLLIKQFFDGIPKELLEAARLDGAGPWRILTRIVLPMSRPILAVVSLLAVMNAWKDFLWPMIAITDTDKQPLAVALPRLADTSDQSLLIAGMLIAIIPPVVVFLVFQRQIVRGIAFTGLK